MKNLLLFVFISLFATTACNAQWGRYKEIKGNGNIVNQDRNLTDFDVVKACCSMEVLVTKSNDFSVKVEADENLQEYILTEINSGRLAIRMREGAQIKPSERITIHVSLPTLRGLKSSSSSDLICSGSFEGDELELDVSSSGNIKVDFTGKYVEIDGSSSGRIELSGSADKVRFDGSSSMRTDARQFSAKRVKAEASSSARLFIGEVTEEIDADVSSSGKVEYRGTPNKVYTDASSGGKVTKGN